MTSPPMARSELEAADPATQQALEGGEASIKAYIGTQSRDRATCRHTCVLAHTQCVVKGEEIFMTRQPGVAPPAWLDPGSNR